MFARKVSMHLKPNTAKDFTTKLDRDVIPLLRKQSGFRDEITFTAKDGKKAVGISLWDSKEGAEAHERGSYPQVLKMLDQVAEGTPRIETYEVSNSTFHKTLAPTRNSRGGRAEGAADPLSQSLPAPCGGLLRRRRGGSLSPTPPAAKPQKGAD